MVSGHKEETFIGSSGADGTNVAAFGEATRYILRLDTGS